MNPIKIVKENWLTRKSYPGAFWITLTSGFILWLWSYFYLLGFINMEVWVPATAGLVFRHHQYWRAWTTLFAHGDLNHLVSNSLLFFPLAYLLSGYYGLFVFPFLAVFMGGVINLIVLQTLPQEALLIGISGVVYWMGATWVALYVLIDRRKKLRQRLALALFLTIMLLTPESYKPNISYLSHFVGYLLGIISGWIIYFIRRKEFHSAEIIEYIYEEEDFDWNFLDSPSNNEKGRAKFN